MNPGHTLEVTGFAPHCASPRLRYSPVSILLWEEILERFSRVEVVGEPVRVASNFIHGYSELPVRVHPLYLSRVGFEPGLLVPVDRVHRVERLATTI